MSVVKIIAGSDRGSLPLIARSEVVDQADDGPLVMLEDTYLNVLSSHRDAPFRSGWRWVSTSACPGTKDLRVNDSIGFAPFP